MIVKRKGVMRTLIWINAHATFFREVACIWLKYRWRTVRILLGHSYYDDKGNELS